MNGNRQQRRRRAAIERQNRFVADYVSHLPEISLDAFGDALGKPGVRHVVVYHDDDCRIFDDGQACNCDPNVRVFAEPRRS
jgi:hypothetical protein